MIFYLKFIISLLIFSSINAINEFENDILFKYDPFINGGIFIAKIGDNIEYKIHEFCVEYKCNKEQFINLLNFIRNYISDSGFIDYFDNIGVSVLDTNEFISNDDKYKVEIRTPSSLQFYIEKYNCQQSQMIGNIELGGAYNICMDNLLNDDKNIVFSAGIYKDASFDIGMANLGFQVLSFDPSNISLEYMKEISDLMPTTMTYYPIGLSNVDIKGVINDGDIHDENSILPEVQLFRLSTVMKELNHEYISFLKLDIEGFEMSVLIDLTDEKKWNDNSPLMNIGQFCMELHWDNKYISIPLHRVAFILEDSFKVLHKYGFREYYRNKRRNGDVQTICMINLNRLKQ
jgi:FkbM family methyltransferase